MKKNSIPCIVFAISIFAVSCMSTEEKKKAAEEEGNAVVAIKSKFVKGAGDALKTDGKEAAESASEGIGEVIKGVTTGFDKSINQANVLADSSFLKTFELGRTEKLFADTVKHKRVTIYLIANTAFTGKVKLKAFDATNKEIGRCTRSITIKEDDAQYFDFTFDNRTPLLQADHFTLGFK